MYLKIFSPFSFFHLENEKKQMRKVPNFWSKTGSPFKSAATKHAGKIPKAQDRENY